MDKRIKEKIKRAADLHTTGDSWAFEDGAIYGYQLAINQLDRYVDSLEQAESYKRALDLHLPWFIRLLRRFNT